MCRDDGGRDGVPIFLTFGSDLVQKSLELQDEGTVGHKSRGVSDCPRSHEVLGTHASGCTGRFVHEVRGRQRELRRAPQPRRAT